ncbi:ENTH/VHS family protein isoform 2 [Tripterygium wilfordii]|uniref:ENTH/VHS family protein isoform 2 n=1 Tax=Tripterygium wilfordii TaxID=458696 RepID=A0A7J7BTZ1_TRIWF|nr:regulation of nuclear pre-mRNA domain-containing protein 1B-like [Tripterygium wilfordii]KAF5725433.1 ENTH/VHS family protein isoform 2 [Tripterygium wilfordii]
MGSTFNSHILVEKLAKLNNSQTSIETLSHWCIFHMHKAKQVVETWARQFHCSPREQRLAFLFLANDILQNSRRKGIEFVGEFWRVLPDALRDVIENGDDFGRNSVLRLIGIWEERKVFGSRAQMLKEELVGRHAEKINRSEKNLSLKLKQPGGNTLDKIVSTYQVVYGSQLDENVILRKCRNAISCLEKVGEEPSGDISSGGLHGAAFMDEVKGQHAILRECIEQLTTVESSRANLVSLMKETLREQEFKLEEIRSQLQVAQSQSEQSHRLIDCNDTELPEQVSKEAYDSMAPPGFISADKEQAAPVMYNQEQMSYPKQSGPIEEGKSAAAVVAAKLMSSTSSAHMLSYVLSSLASEGVIGNPVQDSSGDYPPEKRPKLENDQSYVSPQNSSQPPAPPFVHPESVPQNVITTIQQLTQNEPPPPPPSRSPPPLPPSLPFMSVAYPMPPYIQSVGSVNGEQFRYGMTQQLPPSFPGYPPTTAPVSGISPFSIPPANPYQSFQGPDGNFHNQPPSVPTVPISRQ